MNFVKPYHCFILLIAWLVLPAWAQNDSSIRAQLFSEVESALKLANEANARFYAPINFGKGFKLYQISSEKFNKKRSLESITTALNKSTLFFQTAASLANKAQSELVATIQAKNDAAAASAENFAPKQWLNANKQFAAAIKKFENGKKDSALKKADEATLTYRAAELSAIKNNYLAEARRLIGLAEKQKAYRYAPNTLANAKQLLNQAETELNENRYDTDKARSIARQAKIEAGHSIYLTTELKLLRSGDITPEQFALKMEQPLQKLAVALDTSLELDSGPNRPTEAMAQQIEQLRTDSVELATLKQEFFELEQESIALNKKLGIQSSRLQKQADIKRKITLLESIFTFKEALVYRQGGNILVRMVGLNFPSGKAEIQTQYFDLLRKLIEALSQLPNASLIVEGHTDSFGGDAINLQLSQSRAEAVVKYLQANMSGLSLKLIEAVGYGESKPLANNETAEGQRKNRRIDLLIKPNF